MFEEAGLCKLGDDPAIVAKRIQESNIKQTLVDALDDWAFCVTPPRKSLNYELSWLLNVTHQADPDPQGWRNRFRDPRVRANKEELENSSNWQKTTKRM